MKVTTLDVTSKTIKKKELQKPRKLPISLLTIVFALQFLIGYDLGFHGILKREIRHFFKYYSLVINIVALVIFGIPLFSQNSAKLVFATINFIQFLGQALLLRIAQYKVYHFINDIRAIDSTVRSKEVFGGVSACAYCLIICSINVAIRLIVYPMRNHEVGITEYWTVQILYDLFLTCSDILHILQTLVNYYAYCSVKYLKQLVDNRKSDINDIRKHFIYTADCCDKIWPLYGNLVSDFYLSLILDWQSPLMPAKGGNLRVSNVNIELFDNRSHPSQPRRLYFS